MRLFPVICLIFVAAGSAGAELADFDARFEDATLRIDYFHTGDADREFVALDQLWKQGTWAGSRTRLVDDLDLGRYYAKLYDSATGELLWSRGFDSYFGEWRTTGPAGEGVLRTYHESALVPFPRMPVEFTLESREEGELREIFRTPIDPGDYMIRADPAPAGIVTVDGHLGGDPHGCVDIVIVGDGYTAGETAKFTADVKRFAAVLVGHEPFASHAAMINVRGVLLPSQESGCDEPSRGVHKRTALGSTFDSLGSERYLLTEDNRAMRDVAQAVPYDVLYIMVNHERYGGGGIYNLFCTFTSDNQWSEYVFLHEFGHSFAGLGDEYYTSNVSYDSFYPPGLEPVERNLTELQDPANLKWGDLASPGVDLPTPWNKAAYDAMDQAYQAERGRINDRIGQLMRSGADEQAVAALVEQGEKLSWEHQQALDAWFAANPAVGKVGAFEGAGYRNTGLYRSELDCIMFTKGVKPFCAACRRGVTEVIARYGE